MQVVVTAVGPDHKGLADPIVHHVTGAGANISEIQMFDHQQKAVFAMMLRMNWEVDTLESLRTEMDRIALQKGLSIRVWSPEERAGRPNIAICVTHRP